MFKSIASLSPVCLLAMPAIAQEVPVTTQPAVFLQPALATPADDAEPRVPDGFARSFAAPARDAGGAYRTPNRDLSPSEVTWHVRVALNVAALGCRDEATAYNAMLTTEKVPLAGADAGAQAAERARGGDWQARHDDAMTKLYNFWAQPPAQGGFCAAAGEALREAVNVEPADFPAFAAAALPRLEAPFVAAFARFDGYRAELARWTARHQPAAVPAVTVASASTTPTTAPVLLASVSAPALVPDK